MNSAKRSTGLSAVTTCVVMALLLDSFGLRLYRLDFQSFWSDEGISLQRSAQPLGQLLRRLPVEHLPGYFVLLHFWMAVAGDHDFAMRFLSVWPSVLAIAFVYRLALDLGNRQAGVVAALLLATNAFQVWYAQEARTYSWLLLIGVVASWCLAFIGGPRQAADCLPDRLCAGDYGGSLRPFLWVSDPACPHCLCAWLADRQARLARRGAVGAGWRDRGARLFALAAACAEDF